MHDVALWSAAVLSLLLLLLVLVRTLLREERGTCSRRTSNLNKTNASTSSLLFLLLFTCFEEGDGAFPVAAIAAAAEGEGFAVDCD